MEQRANILVVDDEPLMRISISDALKDEKYKVSSYRRSARRV